MTAKLKQLDNIIENYNMAATRILKVMYQRNGSETQQLHIFTSCFRSELVELH